MRNREENKASKQYRKRQKQEGGGGVIKMESSPSCLYLCSCG